MSHGQQTNNSRRSLALGVMSGVLGAAILVAAPVASASIQDDGGGNIRYNRKSGKIKAKNTLDTKLQTEKKKATKTKDRKVDMMSAEDFARQKEAVSQAVADQQIKKLIMLIKASDETDPLMPDYYFRLADHYLDKKAYFDRQSGVLYEQIYQAEESGNKAAAQQLRAKQKKFENLSKRASADAAGVYKVLINKPQFRKYKRLDEAIYFYAFELGQLKRKQEMQDAYMRLIREYPTSRYIPNAYLSFGDFFYNEQRIPDALKLYQKIVDGYRDSPVYAYALYKMAWCYLNPVGTSEPEYQKSLQKFVDTIKATKEGRAGTEANAKHLRRDARRDLVKAYVHAGRPSKAWEFFQQVGVGPKKGENQARSMMEDLAVQYFGEGMYNDSSFVYRTLQQEYSRDADRCSWQARIVINALATDDKDIQWKETERLAEYWDEYKDSKFKPIVQKKCRDESRDTMRQMATVWHDEAEKTRRLETYDLSEKAYRAFMRYFPKDRDSYEMNYYYAEILWAQGVNNYSSKDRSTQELGLKKFAEAHDQFVNVLKLNPKGKYTKDAAYAQMLAMKNALEYDETGGKAKACKTNHEGVCVYKEKATKRQKVSKDTKVDRMDYPETPYTDDEKRMLEAYDIYQKYVTNQKDEELPKIHYHRAKLMMDHNKFKEARPLLEQLVTKFDGTIYAAWASEMLLDSLVIAWQDKDNTPEQTVKTGNELEQWSKKLQKMKVWKHQEADRVRETVPIVLAGIGWKRGEAYQEQGKNGDPEGFVRCGQEYVTLYNDYGDHPRADTLLFNAARCFEAAYRVGTAIKLRQTLIDNHKDSEHYQQSLRELGQNFHAVAYYDRAAGYYEQYATKYPKDDFSPEALQNAYLFRLGLGDEQQAAKDLSTYEGMFKRKDPSTAAKIFWSKHDLLKTDEEKLAHAREYIRTYGTKGGVDRLVVAEAAIGQILWRQSCSKSGYYDSCISVQREKATAGQKERNKARNLRGRQKRKSKKADIPKYCGNATQGIIVVHDRDKRKAAEAQKHFSTVMKYAGRSPDIPKDDLQRAEAYKNAIGMAMVYNADEEYEEYLRVNLPQGLEFIVEEWKKDSGVPKWEREYKEQVQKRDGSLSQLKDYLGRKNNLAKSLQEKYAKVKSSASPFWTLAAAARSGVMYQNYADQLYRAEVPNSFKLEEEYFAYCDALGDQAAGPEKLAMDAFQYCLGKSTEFQFFNTYSRMCEEELQQRKPDEYPATNELFGTSIYTDSRLDVVGVQSLTGDSDTGTRRRSKTKKSDKGKEEEGASKEGF